MTYIITSDEQLKDRVLSATQYDEDDFTRTDTDLDNLIDDAKLKVFVKTGSDAWYTDSGIGMALYAYTCMRAKAAVENISIEGYTLGNETVKMHNATPEQSQQIQQWVDDIADGLGSSTAVNSAGSTGVINTSGYIGETYVDDYEGW